MRVLLVDDETELVSAMAERLGFRDIEAKWTDTGYKAVDMVRESVKRGVPFDVAVLDVKMPAPAGLELKKKLEELSPGTAFVFLTGHGSQDDFRACEAEAVSLVKPVNIDDLIKSLAAAAAKEC